MPGGNSQGGNINRRLKDEHRQTVRRWAPSLSSLVKEDVESDDIAADEISSYVNVAFETDLAVALTRDFYGSKESTNPEINRRGVRIVWIEHAKTGELVPVTLRGGVATAEDSNDLPEDLNDKNDNANTPLLMPLPLSGRPQDGDVEGGRFAKDSVMDQSNHSYSASVTLIRFAFSFFQGLLAGFCFTTISTQTASSSDTDFVTSYQSNAMEYRRLFYLLSSLSLVGSIDTLFILISKVMQAGGKEKEGLEDSKGVMAHVCRAITVQGDSTLLVATLIAILYGITFLSTLIMSKVDMLIAVRGGASASVQSAVWSADLLSSPNFKNDLSAWKTLDLVRFVCAILGWAGACYLSFKSVTAVEAKNTEILRLKDALFEWQKRVGELEGNEGLESLSADSLRRLVSLQQMGLDRAQNALALASSRKSALS